MNADKLADALRRAERKLSAYVGVCTGDTELTNTILPMCREALAEHDAQASHAAQPVAWTRQDTINDDDGRPIGMDEPRVVWGAECPDPGESWMPLYAEPTLGRGVPAQPALHPATTDLVRRFSVALAEKLAAAEQKYGYSDNWARPGWMDECRQHLLDHIAKGDPRDVAAYCAFLWHHGEHTSPAQPVGVPDGAAHTVQFETKGSPDVAIAVERVSRLSTSDGWVVRVVFRRSDDGRRTTCFYPANEFAAETLHILLAKLTTAAPQPPAQPSADAEDAARYRWLRGEGYERPARLWVVYANPLAPQPIVHTDLDEAIDSARAAEGDGK